MEKSFANVARQVWISPHGDKQLLNDVVEIMKENHGLTFTLKVGKSPYIGR